MVDKEDLKSIVADPSLECIIFDFDGVFVSLETDYPGLKAKLREYARAELGKDVDFSTLNGGLRTLATDGGRGTVDGAYAIVEEYEARGSRNLRLDQAMLSILKAAKSTKKTALFSMNMRATVRALLEEEGVLDCFDVIVTREDVSRYKPDPEGIIRIMNELGVEKSRVLFLGDRSVDAEAGKSAGVRFLMIDASRHGRSD